MNISPASRSATVTTREPRRLSDLVVNQSRVSVRVDGQPMEAVRVPVGNDFVWRIKLTDQLSKEAFADADQAVHWMATGMTLPRGADPAKSDPSAGWITSCVPEPERPDPVWVPLDWEPRLTFTPMPTDPRWVAIEWEAKQAPPTVGPVAAFAKAAALLGFGNRRVARESAPQRVAQAGR